MRIAFFSNFLNHHQLAFCQEMIKIVGEKISTLLHVRRLTSRD